MYKCLKFIHVYIHDDTTLVSQKIVIFEYGSIGKRCKDTI